MMTLKMQTMMLMLVHGQQQQEIPEQRYFCNIRTNYMYALKNSSTETLQPAL